VQSPALAQGPQLASSSAQPSPGAGSDVVGGAVGADVEGMAGDGVAVGGAIGAEVEGSGGTCPPSTAQVQRP